jgi:hypothetical protein
MLMAGDSEGVSLTNGAEDYADAVWQQYLLELPSRPSFVMQYVTGETSTKWGSLLLVTFGDSNSLGSRADAKWETVPTGLKEALQRSAEPDRGSSYQPPAPGVPTSVSKWVTYPVAHLPKSVPFRAPCMRGRRRFVARMLQPFNLRLCGCQYHKGAWAQACATATTALRQSHDEVKQSAEASVDTDAITARALALIRGRSASVEVLLRDPIQLELPYRDSYVNGQHRSQAMKDQRVDRVPILVWVSTTKAPPDDLDYFDT